MATVLVVDDQADLCDVVVRLLRANGHAASYVVDGAAVESVRRAPPDLVILDVMMPGLTGLDVLRAVRRDPGSAGVPVVMFSASPDPDARRAALDLGAANYVLKTLADADQLRVMVDRYAAAGPRQ